MNFFRKRVLMYKIKKKMNKAFNLSYNFGSYTLECNIVIKYWNLNVTVGNDVILFYDNGKFTLVNDIYSPLLEVVDKLLDELLVSIETKLNARRSREAAKAGKLVQDVLSCLKSKEKI